MPDELAPQASAVPPISATATPAPPRRGFDRQMALLVLLYLVIAIGLPVLILTVLRHWLAPPGQQLSLTSTLPFETIQGLSVLFATWVCAVVGHKSMAAFGLPPRQAFGLRFWEGCLWGFVMLSIVVFVLHVLGDFQITGIAIPSESSAIKYALGWGFFFLMVGLFEELFFRGFFLYAIARRLTFWGAAFLLSIFFAVAHLGNPGENALGILQVFVVGMVFCLTLRRTGSLWFAIGLHLAWDWAQTFFYGTPDSGLLGVGHYLNSTASGPKWISGGSAGPEGSVFAFVVILLSGLFIHLRFPKAEYPNRPV